MFFTIDYTDCRALPLLNLKIDLYCQYRRGMEGNSLCFIKKNDAHAAHRLFLTLSRARPPHRSPATATPPLPSLYNIYSKVQYSEYYFRSHRYNLFLLGGCFEVRQAVEVAAALLLQRHVAPALLQLRHVEGRPHRRLGHTATGFRLIG